MHIIPIHLSLTHSLPSRRTGVVYIIKRISYFYKQLLYLLCAILFTHLNNALDTEIRIFALMGMCLCVSASV